MRASDALTAEWARDGDTDGVEVIARMMKDVEVTEAELRAVHAANPSVFGERPFEECRESVEKLARIQRTRRALGGTTAARA